MQLADSHLPFHTDIILFTSISPLQEDVHAGGRLWSHPGLKELLQHLQLLLGPRAHILRSHLQLQGLVSFGVQRHPALQHVSLEIDDARLIRGKDVELQREK